MAKQAVIVDGVVDAIYLGDAPTGVETVQASDDIFAGWTYADGVFTAPAKTLADLQAAKVAEINAKTETLLSAGAPYALGSTTYRIALDDGSRADLTAMASTAIAASSGAVAWPASYSAGWISVENTRIPLATAAAGLALAASVGDWYARIVQHRRDLKDAVLAADSDALAAIDITTGWPS